MTLLIDGYNLLHVSGILGRGIGPGGLQRSRLALLNFLAESVDPNELTRATVVFDAADAPPGLPRTVDHRGIRVHFAAKHEAADALIEELILADSAPRRLVVVSSDHRIQRAARRRRAKAVDSDLWYAALLRARRERNAVAAAVSGRPPVPLLDEDVRYWIRQFGGESALTALVEREAQGADRAEPEKPPESDDADRLRPGALDNPFPPGYGEDLLREL